MGLKLDGVRSKHIKEGKSGTRKIWLIGIWETAMPFEKKKKNPEETPAWN